MPILRLVRVSTNSIHGTLGVLIIDGDPFCVTLEPPSFDNEQNISNIPASQYRCLRVDSPKYRTTFEITDVPNRTHVLFHAGNVVSHTKGCILLGQYFGKLQGNRAVLNSGKTFYNFMKRLSGHDEFLLTITEAY